jgi:hypothetical protein
MSCSEESTEVDADDHDVHAQSSMFDSFEQQQLHVLTRDRDT